MQHVYLICYYLIILSLFVICLCTRNLLLNNLSLWKHANWTIYVLYSFPWLYSYCTKCTHNNVPLYDEQLSISSVNLIICDVRSSERVAGKIFNIQYKFSRLWLVIVTAACFVMENLTNAVEVTCTRTNNIRICSSPTFLIMFYLNCRAMNRNSTDIQ